MKKRILSMVLAIGMLAAMLPAAFAAGQVSTPQNLRWVKEATVIDAVNVYPWDVVWDGSTDGTNEYKISIYKDGIADDNLVEEEWIAFDAADTTVEGLSNSCFRYESRESGTYTFTVQALGDGENWADSEIATSESLEYVAPPDRLACPQNLHWDGTTACWDAVENAGAYSIRWYFSESPDGPFEVVGEDRGIVENNWDLEDWIIAHSGAGYYAFDVKALSNDVNKIRPGEFSSRSGSYNVADTATSISDKLDEILSDLHSSENAEQAVEAVKDLDSEELRVAMDADQDDTGVNSKIKQLEAETGVTVTTQVSEGVDLDPNRISLVGAALNAASGSGTVTFRVSKPAEEAVVSGAYMNAVQFDLTLNGASSGELAVPVKITMPIPENVQPENLCILHYTEENGLREILFPYVFEQDGVWYASFVVTHFSTFVFANEAPAAMIGENYYDTLQEAVDAALSGDTISLYRDHDGTEVQVAGKSLDIACGTYTLDPDTVTVGANCTKTVTGVAGEDQVIHITYRSSSGGGSSSGGSSGGGSSSASSAPSASVNGTGGKVSASSSGTVTITPDEGYQIAGITVNGESVEIPSDGKLTGLDQDDKVVVTFEAIPEEAGDQLFSDVSFAAWYAGAVQYVYENGMMNGTSSTTFGPDETTTRAMIVTILHRLEGEPAAEAAGFTDVAAGTYYADAVDWAAANGIVNGVSETAFAPNDPITREQMAAILYRYAQYKGYDVTASADLSGFADAAQISAYATTAMQWANGTNLITGETSTIINPTGSATRAQVATILMRFCEDIA